MKMPFLRTHRYLYQKRKKMMRQHLPEVQVIVPKFDFYGYIFIKRSNTNMNILIVKIVWINNHFILMK